MTPEQLVEKWKPVLDKSEKIFTWTEPWALAYCCEQAEHADYGVEIGTYMGASAYVMLLANPKLHLWCIDKFEVAGTQKVSEMWLNGFIQAGRCEIIVGDSVRGGSMLQHMAGRLDFVWVDDGHASEDLMRDIGSFYPLLKRGGIMFGHDWDGDNDVAIGVKSTKIPYSIPVPRVWASIKS